MKKKVFITVALVAAALAAGGLLYFKHVVPLEKAVAAPAPPPAAPVKKAEVTAKVGPTTTDIPSQVPTIADNSTWKMPADATAIIHAQDAQTPPAPAPRTTTTRRTISGTTPATVQTTPITPAPNENVFSEPPAICMN